MKKTHTPENRGVVTEMAKTIVDTFASFDVFLELTDAKEGLSAYYFRFRTLKPVRMRAIHTFADDLKYALEVTRVEIEAPILGEKLIGIRVPKEEDLSPILVSDQKNTGRTYAPLEVPIGIGEFGGEVCVDIAREPHLLVGGSTGSGKSQFLHNLIVTLTERHDPSMLRLLLIDPKRVEFGVYSGLPHLLTDTITDPRKMLMALKWTIMEMERRYEILENLKLRDISKYHRYQKESGDPEIETLPYILVVFDELADLMCLYPKETEMSIVRVASMSRAVGIHFVVLTQRPEIKVVTGLMKAYLPGRVAFRVNSQIDSRVLIDRTGAEQLRGKGDMIFLSSSTPHAVRAQAFYVPDDVIESHVKRIMKRTRFAERDGGNIFEKRNEAGMLQIDWDDSDDDLYEDAKRAVIASRKASTSFLQRKLGVGYSRAAKLIDMLAAGGVVSDVSKNGVRSVLIEE